MATVTTMVGGNCVAAEADELSARRSGCRPKIVAPNRKAVVLLMRWGRVRVPLAVSAERQSGFVTAQIGRSDRATVVPTGCQQAELVAVRIGHDHLTDIALPDVDPHRPKRDQAIYLGSLIFMVGRGDVEMKSVLPNFGMSGGLLQLMIGPVPSGAQIAVSSS